MERFGTGPANLGNARAELVLERMRRSEPGFSEGNREKAPHPAGCAVVVGFGLAAAADGVGLGVTHGLPPALVSETVI